MGQGCGSGLAGLAEDHGIAGGTPARLPASAPGVPRPAKARRPVRAGREPSPAAALFGEDFPEFVREGTGSMEFTVDEPLPTGFFVVDTERSGDGSFMVDSCTPRARGVRDAHPLVDEPERRPKYRVPLPEGPVPVRIGDAEGNRSLEVRPTP
ncbi:hypothetical protein ACFQ8C_05860 [Streptomyces sp. NPDC056503]|uniref:hypothetical protein n=1 Tax=Streptomyces sp. NPDC056503 TaxID=3345842 RepID=UPI0036A5D6B6